ncbi:hypothetical protein KUTeg_022006, partial [Tegillarca granosa]
MASYDKDNTKVKQEETTKENQKPVPCCCSQRWILAYLSFFGFFCLFALRTNISVAIVCMVNTKNLTHGILFNGSYDNTTTPHPCITEESSSSLSEHEGFDWNKTLMSSILASFFYGYTVTQIPGGWLADKFGGKKVLGIGLLISAISTIILPVCARPVLHPGVCFESYHRFGTAVLSMWGRWAPPLESTKLTSFIQLGAVFGMFGTLSSGGVLCHYGFDHGWGSIFILTGGLTVIWVLVWFLTTSDSPATHRFITEVEKQYILSSIGHIHVHDKKTKIPWKSIATSMPFVACLTAHFCYNWTNYTLMTSLPIFMKEALHLDVKQNGLLSSFPFLTQVISAFIAGHGADSLRYRKILSNTAIRKLFQISSAGVFLVVCGYLNCQQKYIIVVCLCMSTFCLGFSVAGFLCNHVDIAPRYAGVLFGITNTIATIPGMLAPIVAGALTHNHDQQCPTLLAGQNVNACNIVVHVRKASMQTAEEWRSVFFVCLGFNLLGIIVYGAFASGEVQTWGTNLNIEIEVKKGEKQTLENGIAMIGNLQS